MITYSREFGGDFLPLIFTNRDTLAHLTPGSGASGSSAMIHLKKCFRIVNFFMSNKTFSKKRKQSCFSANRYSGCFCRFSPALRAFYGKNQLFFMIFRNFEKSQNILGHLLDRGPYDVRVRSEKRTAPDKRVHPR